MRTANETAADLYAVPDHLAMAMLTHGCDRLNGAFQAVECMFRAGSYEIETFIVVVTANFARSHWNSSIPVFDATQQNAVGRAVLMAATRFCK
jgi:hypothetical protein